jgi:hypothetical protein
MVGRTAIVPFLAICLNGMATGFLNPCHRYSLNQALRSVGQKYISSLNERTCSIPTNELKAWRHRSQNIQMIWGRKPEELNSPYEPKKVLPLLSGGNLVIGKDGWFIDAPHEDEQSKAKVADFYGDQAIPIEIEDQMAWLLYRNGLVITTITGMPVPDIIWPPVLSVGIADRPRHRCRVRPGHIRPHPRRLAVGPNHHHPGRHFPPRGHHRPHLRHLGAVLPRRPEPRLSPRRLALPRRPRHHHRGGTRPVAARRRERGAAAGETSQRGRS